MLETWLRSQDDHLLLQKSKAHFQAPTWDFKHTGLSSPKRFNVIIQPPLGPLVHLLLRPEAPAELVLVLF